MKKNKKRLPVKKQSVPKSPVAKLELVKRLTREINSLAHHFEGNLRQSHDSNARKGFERKINARAAVLRALEESDKELHGEALQFISLLS